MSFNYTDRGKQLICFDGIINEGKLGATDIDAIIEYKDKAYIFFEVKLVDAPMPDGQRLALQRLVDDIGSMGKKAVAAVVTHWTRPEEDIQLQHCLVREVYVSSERKWRTPNFEWGRELTAKHLVDLFLEGVRQ